MEQQQKIDEQQQKIDEQQRQIYELQQQQGEIWEQTAKRAVRKINGVKDYTPSHEKRSGKSEPVVLKYTVLDPYR